ncbi:MAG: DUF1707 domain-containing protein [Gemmatimonadota bacterium]
MSGTEDRIQVPAEEPTERERTVAELCRHFARDHLDVTELERRLDRAYAARTNAELEGTLEGLPALPTPAAAREGVPVPAPVVEPALEVPERGFLMAVMGGAERNGVWTPPRRLVVLAVMGGAGLDLREARLGSSVTELFVVAVMGGAEIIVPPGMRVDVGGTAVMGAFEHRRQAAEPAPDAPLLRVNGLALMGGVEVKVRLPGETEKEARRRLRAERRAGYSPTPGE